MSKHSGIPSNPVIFEKGIPLTAPREADISNPQNLWQSIDANQEWVGRAVLKAGTDKSYTEARTSVSIGQIKRIASDMLKRGDNYTNARNLDSFSVLFHQVDKELSIAEFRDKSVLDIGSGAGLFSEDLRQEAGAVVTELDILGKVMKKLPDIKKGQGERVVADARDIPFQDGAFDRTVSMYSASVHTDTVSDRLTSLAETLRVTKEGGRAFVVPTFTQMVLRQQRWARLMEIEGAKGTLDTEFQAVKRILMQEAAIDYALTHFVRTLIATDSIDFTPVLAQKYTVDGISDVINGIFDIKRPITKDMTEPLIQESVNLFSRK